MNDAVIMIAATDIRHHIEGEPDLTKRIEKAFAQAQDFWMATDDDTRFRGALAAVLLETKDETERDRVIRSKQALDKFDAFLRASRAGLEVSADDLPHPGNDDTLIPLLKLWHVAKDKAR